MTKQARRDQGEVGKVAIRYRDAADRKLAPALGDLLQIGDVKFRISEVREYALRGANLPLQGGRLLQAAMALLVTSTLANPLAT